MIYTISTVPQAQIARMFCESKLLSKQNSESAIDEYRSLFFVKALLFSYFSCMTVE